MARRWPAIPKMLDGLAGPIRVKIRRVESFKAEDGDEVWGLYKPAVREIHLAQKLPAALRWHTLAHEWAHAWLLDSGLQNILRGEGADHAQQVEAVCDALATNLVRTMAGFFRLNPYERE